MSDREGGPWEEPQGWAARRAALPEQYRAVAEALGKPMTPFELDGAVGRDARDYEPNHLCAGAIYDRRGLLNVLAAILARPAPPSEGPAECGFGEPHEPHEYVVAGPDGTALDLPCPGRPAPPSEGLDVELERLHRIEHAARDVDGLWSESRTLIHWQVEAGEALRDLRAALPLADPSAAKETDHD